MRNGKGWMNVWRAIWLYGPRRRVLGFVMTAATTMGGWVLVELLTQPASPDGPRWLELLPVFMQDVAQWNNADKLAHAGLFGSVSVGALIALFHLGFGSRRRVALFTFLGVGVVFGTATEVAQMYVPTRTFDVWDIVADATGSFLAITAWLLIGAAVAGRGARQGTDNDSAPVAMSPIGPLSRFVPHTDVEVKREPPTADGEGGGLLLVNLRTGMAFRMNATGELLWPGIVAGETTAELTSRLRHAYPHANNDRVQRDTIALVRALWQNRLVVPVARLAVPGTNARR